MSTLENFETNGDWIRPVMVSNVENVFDDLYDIHYNVCLHQKVKVMNYHVHARHGKSIPRNYVNLFCQTCPICVSNARRFQEKKIIKPVLTKGFGKRGQVDLIDWRNQVSNGYKFILVYQDHGKKFIILFKLTNGLI